MYSNSGFECSEKSRRLYFDVNKNPIYPVFPVMKLQLLTGTTNIEKN